MIKFFTKKNKGFTLVETLVAVTIFTVSITALFTVLSQGIANDTYARRKTTAEYLAQEGVEYIRNIRDTYVLYDSTSAQNGWNNFKVKLNTCTGANGCYFGDIPSGYYSILSQPITNLAVTACIASCPALLYDNSSGKYGYFGVDSGFIRKIQMTTVSSDEVKIYSTVSWVQGSGTQSVTFSEDLFNWVE